jgi:hypothetical protein
MGPSGASPPPALDGELRPLFNDKKADPTHDEAVFVTTSPNGTERPHQYACTASLAVITSNRII